MLKKTLRPVGVELRPSGKTLLFSRSVFDTEPNQHGIMCRHWIYKPLLFTHFTHWCVSASYWIILH